MSEKFKKFSKALDSLISEGDMLYMSIRLDCFGEEFAETLRKETDGKKVDEFLKKLPNFGEKYQAGIPKHCLS